MRADEWPPIARRLQAAYPSFVNDPEAESVYLDVLADVDATAVDRAVGEILREGREDAPPPGVLRARALGQQPQAGQQQPEASDSRDTGARRGLGWVGVLVVIALGLGVAALVVALANDDDSPSITQTDVDLQPSETPSDSQPSDSAPSDSQPSAPSSSGSEAPSSGSEPPASGSDTGGSEAP